MITRTYIMNRNLHPGDLSGVLVDNTGSNLVPADTEITVIVKLTSAPGTLPQRLRLEGHYYKFTWEVDGSSPPASRDDEVLSDVVEMVNQMHEWTISTPALIQTFPDGHISRRVKKIELSSPGSNTVPIFVQSIDIQYPDGTIFPGDSTGGGSVTPPPPPPPGSGGGTIPPTGGTTGTRTAQEAYCPHCGKKVELVLKE